MTACPHCGSPIYEIGIEFIFAENLIRAGGRECKLRPTQMQMLEYLVDAYPRALANDALHAALYEARSEDNTPSVNSLAQQVSDMRKRLREHGLPLDVMSVGTSGESGLMIVPTAQREFIQKVA